MTPAKSMLLTMRIIAKSMAFSFHVSGENIHIRIYLLIFAAMSQPILGLGKSDTLHPPSTAFNS